MKFIFAASLLSTACASQAKFTEFKAKHAKTYESAEEESKSELVSITTIPNPHPPPPLHSNTSLSKRYYQGLPFSLRTLTWLMPVTRLSWPSEAMPSMVSPSSRT